MTALKTSGEIEDAICTGIIQFEREFMGRGPSRINTFLLDDAILVRMRDVLTPAERHLIETRPPEEGCDLVKRMRAKLLDAATPALSKLVESITGIVPIVVHHHVCTETGEEIILFTFDRSVPRRQVDHEDHPLSSVRRGQRKTV